MNLRHPSWIAPSALLVLALLLGLGAPTTLLAEDKTGAQGLDLEAASTGGRFLHALPDWSWRPGHAELVRWARRARGATRDGDAVRDVLLLRDAESGAERVVVAEDALRAAAAGLRCEVEGIGRGDAPRHVFSSDGEALVVVENGRLLVVDVASGSVRALAPLPRPVRDLQISPDRSRISFSMDYDLWSLPLAGGEAQSLTVGGTEEVRLGTLDWLYPEELGWKSAHVWSPDAKRVAFLALDESDVPFFEVPRFLEHYPQVEPMRYPKAGDANPRARVGFVRPGHPDEIVWAHFGEPAPEYVLQFVWAPDATSLIVLVFDRGQQHLRAMRVDAATGLSTLLFQERSAKWIDPPPRLTFIDENKFVFQSVREGEPNWFVGTMPAKGEVVDWRPLAEPKLHLVGEPFLDAATGRAVAHRLDGMRRTVVVRDGWDEPWRTASFAGAAPASTKAVWNDAGTHAWVDVSSPLLPPARRVLRVDGLGTPQWLGSARTRAFSGLVLAVPEEGELPPLDTEHAPRRPDGTLAAVRWRLWRKRSSTPSEPRPVIVHVYGGPGSQTIDGGWQRSALLATWLGERGFHLLQVDGRGTGGQGQAFQHEVRSQLGLAEVDDVARVVRHVATFRDVDASRVGITGWSFGGTLALLGVLRHPDVFHAAVAVAPVTDWRLYDTIYTERYMGLPSANAAGYDATSAVKLAAGLSRPLLLVHGLADDNVHAQNSMQLVDALLRAKNAHFEMAFYPNQRHSLGIARRDMERRTFDFFERVLR